MYLGWRVSAFILLVYGCAVPFASGVNLPSWFRYIFRLGDDINANKWSESQQHAFKTSATTEVEYGSSNAELLDKVIILRNTLKQYKRSNDLLKQKVIDINEHWLIEKRELIASHSNTVATLKREHRDVLIQTIDALDLEKSRVLANEQESHGRTIEQLQAASRQAADDNVALKERVASLSAEVAQCKVQLRNAEAASNSQMQTIDELKEDLRKRATVIQRTVNNSGEAVVVPEVKVSRRTTKNSAPLSTLSSKSSVKGGRSASTTRNAKQRGTVRSGNVVQGSSKRTK